ncbi:MAG: biosynthetic peptidoglycan transglycosylase [Caldimonas sp.]
MKPVVRRTLLWLAGLAAFAVCGAAVLFGVSLFALRAGPGDWSQRVSLGPVGMDISVPALARVASHPLGMRLLAGRSAATRYGRIGVAAGTEPGTLVVTCAPCVVGNASLAARPIRLAAVEFTVAAGEPNQLLGTIRVGVVRANWQVRLGARDARLEVDIADAALADLVALFGDAVPEAAVARIGGRGGAAIRVALPSGRYSVRPRLDGVVVAGLGTDVLAGATPAPSCGRTPRAQRSASPYGTWLARAVIAAEDQRFYEHAGYDTAEMAAAWSTEAPHAERRRGASTLSQQLAKLLYTGDDRTLARKIRELLYAVELDRALGKARVLQLYLAVAPWGDGVCGGEAAALHYFGKHAASLGPAEAVWLAGLLRNPELELTRGAQGAPADNGRLVVIGESIRPISRQRRTDLREQLERMVPPPPVLARAEAAAAGR